MKRNYSRKKSSPHQQCVVYLCVVILPGFVHGEFNLTFPIIRWRSFPAQMQHNRQFPFYETSCLKPLDLTDGECH